MCSSRYGFAPAAEMQRLSAFLRNGFVCWTPVTSRWPLWVAGRRGYGAYRRTHG
ncbi:hypothetical protein BIFGAL_03374 [Bifidobacterium gallicum DSM 20093 = LMG 11596]|uniref:Uncharacterized protein n=1 Tax=Bifidobacterium gallicum DSM 20093 = LMG 11596 TaxID=561180 RepID=D1NU53_9BIFI|nr:hypothetical protein BIFGAL_03374 [Bifidobacterium gallicum DSM 20093 = LMG 11596]